MKQVMTAKSDTASFFAVLVSLIAHPVVLGTLGLFAVVMHSVPELSQQFYYVALLMLLTFAPAALYLFVLFKGNLVNMLELIDREARLIPYLLMIVGAILAVIILIRIAAPPQIFIMTVVLLANEIVLGTINFWTKVSIHTATVTFMAMTLGYLLSHTWLFLLLLIPIVGWARVYRKRHTITQVAAGALFASLITIFVLVAQQRYF